MRVYKLGDAVLCEFVSGSWHALARIFCVPRVLVLDRSCVSVRVFVCVFVPSRLIVVPPKLLRHSPPYSVYFGRDS